MNYITIISFFLTMLILIAIPGPGVFTIVAKSLSSGYRAALTAVFGIAVGHISYLLLAIFGLSYIAKTLGTFFIIIKICGGAYLIWLGCKIWFTESSKNSFKRINMEQSKFENFVTGLLTTLSNPKAILFYCGLLPAFMDLSTLNALDVILSTVIVTISVIIVLGFYAYCASKTRDLFSSKKAVKRLNRTAGSVMIATGVVIATKS